MVSSTAPNAKVYLEGSATPLCDDPCEVEVDPAKPKKLVVKAKGFMDAPVEVSEKSPNGIKVPMTSAPASGTYVPPKSTGLGVGVDKDPWAH
jgi:hypothetical protein